MRIVRIVGGILMALALIALGADALASFEQGGLAVAALGELWFRLDPGSLNLMQAVVQRYLWPGLWDLVIVAILRLPAIAVFGVPAIVLLLLGSLPRRRRMFY